MSLPFSFPHSPLALPLPWPCFTDTRSGQGEWLYPIDQVSNIPVRNIMAEFTREAIFLRAHEEVSAPSPTHLWQPHWAACSRAVEAVGAGEDKDRRLRSRGRHVHRVVTETAAEAAGGALAPPGLPPKAAATSPAFLASAGA